MSRSPVKRMRLYIRSRSYDARQRSTHAAGLRLSRPTKDPIGSIIQIAPWTTPASPLLTPDPCNEAVRTDANR